MAKLLFDEFDSVSAKQWKQKIQFDLKGADYNTTLLTETNEGITINPFYHSDTTKYLQVPLPSETFSICQTIFVDDVSKANSLARKALKRGANSLKFEANEPFDIAILFNNLVSIHQPTEKQSLVIHFKLNFLSQSFVSDLIKNTTQFTVFLNIDIIGNLTKSGNWFTNKDKDHKQVEAILKMASEKVTVLGVEASLYQNAGANTVQQVAYALAHANEYLNAFADIGLPPSNKMQFTFAVGSHYFFEIAKLRAFRYLFDLITGEYNLNIEPEIFVQPTLRNKSIYDYNVNMLRTTTECMSAILGGANCVSNVAYDTLFHKSNEFGERIARNQLLVLQEESYFKEAQNAVEGTYYIETLTIQIAEKALQLFKEIEQKGGFVNQLFSGVIQRKIADSAKKEQEQFDTGNFHLLGVNKYPNPKDKMADDLQLYPFIKINARKTLIRPIIPKRLAEEMEQERLAQESKS